MYAGRFFLVVTIHVFIGNGIHLVVPVDLHPDLVLDADEAGQLDYDIEPSILEAMPEQVLQGMVARTPMGRSKNGCFRNVRADDLSVGVIKGLLARNEAALGNFKAAYEAQQAVLSIKGAEATASDYADYADMMILAAGGYVSPEAENALRGALARDASNGTARYYMGLMAAQTGRPDQAFRVWDALLKEGPSDAPWIAPIRSQIEEMAARA